MMWQWIGLVLFSVTVLPAGLALAVDWVPRRLRTWLAPVRPRGWYLLLLYSVALLNTIPRLAGASSTVTRTCTAAGGILCLAGLLLLGIATHRHQNRGADRPRSAV